MGSLESKPQKYYSDYLSGGHFLDHSPGFPSPMFFLFWLLQFVYMYILYEAFILKTVTFACLKK